MEDEEEDVEEEKDKGTGSESKRTCGVWMLARCLDEIGARGCSLDGIGTHKG